MALLKVIRDIAGIMEERLTWSRMWKSIQAGQRQWCAMERAAGSWLGEGTVIPP